MNKLSQSQVQKMLQRLSPQQIQMIKLLELPTIQLEQRIKKEIEENPALEEDTEHDDYESKEIDIEEYKRQEEIPYYKLNINNHSQDDKVFTMPLSDGLTITEYLNEQLSFLQTNDTTYLVAQYIIGSLDRNGYLRRDLESIQDDLAFNMGLDVEMPQIEEALALVQSLEPHGIAARDLQETLLIQLNYLPKTSSTLLAIKIIKESFEQFSRKHYDKIILKYELEEEELRNAINVITNLSPKPANLYTEHLQSEPTIQIVPDFVLENQDGILEVSLGKSSNGEVKINKSYLELLSSLIKESKSDKESDFTSEENKEAAQFIKQKIESAKWFISAIKQRNVTMLMTMNAILDFQKEYFQDGDETKLKPMILKDISDLTGLDVSTVSRVANSKYIQTDFGIYPLKYFFSEAMKTADGEEVSSREIKTILQECVDNEEKRNPLTDGALMDILQDKGYKIARRTVAKYREMLDIPVARMRKEF